MATKNTKQKAKPKAKKVAGAGAFFGATSKTKKPANRNKKA